MVAVKKARRLKNRRAASAKSAEIVAVGDVHGELAGFLEILLHAGLIDELGRWRGGAKILVQMGDVIDRGPHSLEALRFLARLSKQARASGGKIVQLLGNHELELLRGNGYLCTLSPEEAHKLRASLKEDILGGRLLGAYSRQGWLFTHAGVSGEIMRSLSPRCEKPEPDFLAREINGVLLRAAEKNDYSHPIFNIGSSRGGRHRHGGIFWEDAREIFLSPGARAVRQVFAHTPLKRIVVSADGALAAIDVGMFGGYGGGRAYVRIKKSKLSVVDMTAPQPS